MDVFIKKAVPGTAERRIDMKYEIVGDNLPAVVCYLEAGEQIITENGGMSWMSPNMTMSTSGGGFKKAFGRAFSGESMFRNIYTSQGGPGMLAIASSFPGSIKAYEISAGREVILQKKAFLGSSAGVEMSVFFQKKISTGIFGGEGFIMQKASGSGLVFAEFDGYIQEYELQAGQQMIIDTGHLAACDATCSIDIISVKGIKNKFLGGEGFFNTIVTGPGKIYLQTMPLQNVAGAIAPFLPTSNNS